MNADNIISLIIIGILAAAIPLAYDSGYKAGHNEGYNKGFVNATEIAEPLLKTAPRPDLWPTMSPTKTFYQNLTGRMWCRYARLNETAINSSSVFITKIALDYPDGFIICQEGA